MQRSLDRRILIVAALALVGAALLVVPLFLGDDERESGLGGSIGPEPRGIGTAIRRREASSTRPRFLRAAEDETWEPLQETEEERRKLLVRVRAEILETGRPVHGTDCSLLARHEERGWQRMVHGRLEEPGLFVFRLARGYRPVGARLMNGPPWDDEDAFVPGSYFVEPEETEEGFDLRVRPSRAPAIAGIVIDAASGRPLTGARVLVKGGDRRKPWRTETDDLGAFALHALVESAFATPRLLDLRVEARGHVARDLAVDLPAGATLVSDLRLALDPALRIGGYLLDEGGSPVADQPLTLLVEPAPGRAPIRRVEALIEATTDGGGRFVFEGVPGDRRLEIRCEPEGLLPGRFRLEPQTVDRGDLRLVLERGRRIGLELLEPDGSRLEGRIVRIFRRDEAGDWCVLPLDVLDERREIAVSERRQEEILVFAQLGGPYWRRGRVLIAPEQGRDRLPVPLEPFQDGRAVAPDSGLEADCGWGVQVVVAHPGDPEAFRSIHLGDDRSLLVKGPHDLRFLVAPGTTIVYAGAGTAPERFLVVGEPGGELRLEARPRPAERPER